MKMSVDQIKANVYGLPEALQFITKIWQMPVIAYNRHENVRFVSII